jgi:hypothetical protein
MGGNVEAFAYVAAFVIRPLGQMLIKDILLKLYFKAYL